MRHQPRSTAASNHRPRLDAVPTGTLGSVRVATFSLLLACSLPACRQSPPELGPDVVAQVGDRHITVTEVAEELRRRPAPSATNADPDSRRRAALNTLIDDEALFQQAKAIGLDRDPEIARRIRRLVVQEFRERSLGAEAEVKLSDEELRRWYDNHPETFLEAARVRASLIALRVPPSASREQRQAAQQRLEQARQSILAAPDIAQTFAAQAREISDDPTTRRQGGDTGWLTEGRLTRWPQEVTAYLFHPSNTGTPSPVIETPEGLFLVRVAERRPAHRRPFHEVQASLSHQVSRAKREEQFREWVARSRAATSIRENPSALAAITVPPPGTALTQSVPTLPGSAHSAAELETTAPLSLSKP